MVFDLLNIHSKVGLHLKNLTEQVLCGLINTVQLDVSLEYSLVDLHVIAAVLKW